MKRVEHEPDFLGLQAEGPSRCEPKDEDLGHADGFSGRRNAEVVTCVAAGLDQAQDRSVVVDDEIVEFQMEVGERTEETDNVRL